MFKTYIQKRLENYVQEYFAKHSEVKLVVVTGSVGKTSTKVAIATVLSEKFRVRLHEGNYNTFLSAPCAILGIEYPDNIRNILEWLAVFRAARQRINQPTDVDVIVQELGSDRIGQVEHFGTYLKPDIAVITAISPEHMEYFMTLDNVAKEELAVANYSKSALINRDDFDGKYAEYLNNANFKTYGTSATAEYKFLVDDYSLHGGFIGKFVRPGNENAVKANIHTVGEHMLRPAVAAAAVATEFGMDGVFIASGLEKVEALPGRMKPLRGTNGTLLIDDTYNSSPLAAASSLNALYQLQVPQRIAVLGSMNELGATSEEEHASIGNLCDPAQLAWVITVGDEAEKFLAPAARARGCQVESFKTALQAGAFVRKVVEPNAAVLYKGSQGNIYLEEAVKMMLHTIDDEKLLVRQSPQWMRKKEAFFSNF